LSSCSNWTRYIVKAGFKAGFVTDFVMDLEIEFVTDLATDFATEVEDFAILADFAGFAAVNPPEFLEAGFCA
jgi:hypothetical protein